MEADPQDRGWEGVREWLIHVSRSLVARHCLLTHRASQIDLFGIVSFYIKKPCSERSDRATSGGYDRVSLASGCAVERSGAEVVGGFQGGFMNILLGASYWTIV